MKEVTMRRLIQILLMITLLVGVEGLRLAWVQLISGRSYAAGAGSAKEAVNQRSDGFVLDNGRGQFTDRSGLPLTGVAVRGLVAFPDYGMPRGPEPAVTKLAISLGTTGERLEAWLREIKEPAVWKPPHSATALSLTDEQIRAAAEADLLGVAVLPVRNRYPEGSSPLHAVGYVSQNPGRMALQYPEQVAGGKYRSSDSIGGAGLEQSMDRLLRGVGPTVVSQITDAVRRPLGGLGLRTTSPRNPHFPLQVHTTLDAGVQRAAEQALLRAGVRAGGAVVLDAANADILAMVSLPRLDPYRVGASGTDERNHAITAYPPGSIFKTVTLAAAIESGEADLGTMLHCDGKYDRYGLRCWRPEGHGDLTLEQAYADSCNVAFAAIADGLDPAWIQITAERLGLGRQVGWRTDSFVDGKPLRLLGEEESGAIFADQRTAQDGGVRAGTGIGQRDVRVTPLQAANLVVTLLHGGRVTAPRLVTDIRYADGAWMAELPKQDSLSKYGEIRPQTASAVLKAMRSVVTDGTASKALASSSWPLAGKSGTAELAGKQQARNDQWFIGYGPVVGTPRYAVAILIENQPAGLPNRAAAVFGDVMERLRLLEETPGSAPQAAASADGRKIPPSAHGSNGGNIPGRTKL